MPGYTITMLGRDLDEASGSEPKSIKELSVNLKDLPKISKEISDFKIKDEAEKLVMWGLLIDDEVTHKAIKEDGFSKIEAAGTMPVYLSCESSLIPVEVNTASILAYIFQCSAGDRAKAKGAQNPDVTGMLPKAYLAKVKAELNLTP